VDSTPPRQQDKPQPVNLTKADGFIEPDPQVYEWYPKTTHLAEDALVGPFDFHNQQRGDSQDPVSPTKKKTTTKTFLSSMFDISLYSFISGEYQCYVLYYSTCLSFPYSASPMRSEA
jgi:hypothetical protein